MDPVPDLGRRGVGGSWRSNRKGGAVGAVVQQSSSGAVDTAGCV